MTRWPITDFANFAPISDNIPVFLDVITISANIARNVSPFLATCEKTIDKIGASDLEATTPTHLDTHDFDNFYRRSSSAYISYCR